MQELMNSYHKIAMSQADQSFKACQVAMGVGLLLIVGFGVAAVIQTDPVAAAAAGAISVVSDAVSAYISATYMKAYTQATAQIRQFFIQPADFTRRLGTERLIGLVTDDDHKKEAVMIVLQSMSLASPFTPAELGKGVQKAIGDGKV
ncbi:hypothetical protein [Arthrobacter sp. NPDC057013]